MTLTLFGHPFSSYTWKVLIALDEKQLSFGYNVLDPDHPEHGETVARLAPTGLFPVLTDGDTSIVEASAIIEYLDVIQPAPRLIPDGKAGVEVRMMDRIFDNYVMGAMQKFVGHRLGRDTEDEAAKGAATLDQSYAWLDARLGDGWACGGDFSMADCAAAPSLFYADWVHPIPDKHATLKAYRARLLAHPSVAKAVDAARPYRSYFPGGAPDRD